MTSAHLFYRLQSGIGRRLGLARRTRVEALEARVRAAEAAAQMERDAKACRLGRLTAERERAAAEHQQELAAAARRADEAARQADEAARQADEAARQADEARQQADEARQQADKARQQADEAWQQVDEARRRASEADAARAAVAAESGAVRERYYAALARFPGTRPTDAELIASLREAGVPVTAADRVVLHVGFGHAATTSLQHAFFARRDDLYYPGLPYAEAGGFFSYLKYTEDHLLDPALMLRLCRDWVYAAPGRRGRPIAVSDEMFTEPGEVYYHPHVLPGPQVAARLKRFFPTAKVVFTTRRQPDYVASMYFNLKRNYAYLAGMPVPPFDEWWDGVMHTQARGPYLLNLDFAPLVRVYAELFGRDNVLVLPLEELKARGDRAYLGRLCGFMGLPPRDADLDHFRRPRNERMSVVEARVADLLAARQADAAVRQALGNERLAAVAGMAPRATLDLRDEVAAEIRRLVAPGNRWLAETFGLPLGVWGYPV